MTRVEERTPPPGRPGGIGLDAVLRVLDPEGRARRSGSSWEVHCPAHEDRESSLSAGEGDEGRVLLYCHAGCTVEEVCAAAGLTLANLAPTTQETTVPEPAQQLCVRHYPAVHATTGEMVSDHVRVEFSDGSKRYSWRPTLRSKGVRAADLALFGWENCGDLVDGAEIIVCEGEPATVALQWAGVAAVGTMTGASSVPCDDALRPLCRLSPVLWPDNDGPGRQHAEGIAGQLRRLGAASLAVLEWAEAPEHGDAADLIRPVRDAGTGPAAAAALVSALPRMPWGGLPSIRVNGRVARELSDEAVAALVAANRPAQLFVRSGELVRVTMDERDRPVIGVVGHAALRGMMMRAADFQRVSRSGEATDVFPPRDVVEDVRSLGAWPLPPLEAIVEAPVLRPDGTVVDRAGYDPATRLLYVPAPGLEVGPVPVSPTPVEVAGALELVDEMIGEMPFDGQPSRAGAIALLLTPVVRPAIGGPVPLALIDAPQAGTGKSLLAAVVAAVATGRPSEVMTPPRSEEEWRKLITSVLVAGSTIVCLDNIEAALSAPALAGALTSTTWRDRVLGRSEMVSVPQLVTWIATGNNLALRGDLPRRCHRIRLDAQTSRPWTRRGFTHPDLLGWVGTQRGDLLRALLVLARAWYANGRASWSEEVLGSFEEWTRVIGGVLTHAGVKGFLGDLERLYEEADEEAPQWTAFLDGLRERFGEEPFSTSQVNAEIRRDGSSLGQVVPDELAGDLEKEATFVRRLGRRFTKNIGRRFGDEELHLVKAQPDLHRKAPRWTVLSDLRGMQGLRGYAATRAREGNGAGNSEEYLHDSCRKSPGETPPTPHTPQPPDGLLDGW